MKKGVAVLVLLAVVFTVVTYADGVSNTVVGKFITGQIPYVRNEDGSMIPDKYNTGPDPSIALTNFNPAPGETVNVSGIKIMRCTESYMGENYLLLNYKFLGDAPDVSVIENYDFSYYEFQVSGAPLVERTIIFKNCKFNHLKFDVVRDWHAKYEFYDCEFNTVEGNFMKFERCLFHPLVFDALDTQQDVSVKDSYIFFVGDSRSAGKHIDGVQTAGVRQDPTFDVANISFNNVRMEMPQIKVAGPDGEWFFPLLNAPIMVSLEGAYYGHNISFENIHANGGGHSIYWSCSNETKKKNVCRSLTNTLSRNIVVGYGHMYSMMNEYHNNVDMDTWVIENVDHVTDLYICSVWKNSAGVHVSVTNELLTNRTMTCTADGKVSATHTIPAHPKIPKDKIVEHYLVFDDFPYDIDLIVADKSAHEVSCYDVTETGDVNNSPLLKTVIFSGDASGDTSGDTSGVSSEQLSAGHVSSMCYSMKLFIAAVFAFFLMV